MKRNWRRFKPASFADALRGCKDYALDRKNLSVERIADLMAITPDVLYKWLSTGRMPGNVIPTYELVCGCHFASDWLANTSGRMVIAMPTGKHSDARDMHRLQEALHTAQGAVIAFYDRTIGQDECQAQIMRGMEALGWHHENVERYEQPQLDLDQ